MLIISDKDLGRMVNGAISGPLEYFYSIDTLNLTRDSIIKNKEELNVELKRRIERAMKNGGGVYETVGKEHDTSFTKDFSKIREFQINTVRPQLFSVKKESYQIIEYMP